MEIIFNKDYLRDLYITGKTDKKHRFQPHIIRKYIRIIDLMIEKDDITALTQYNSLNYKKIERQQCEFILGKSKRPISYRV